MNKKQIFNPYLPSWEYIPDGEPHVFGDRLYLFGSHDSYNGHVFCLGDYVLWSTPINDLSDWRCEGVIYRKTDDPLNREGKMCLYAPDVICGPDGRYYLYYALDKVPVISVAVCDTPAGKYEFYGYVHDVNGNRLGEREGDEPQFDPSVLMVGNDIYLYTGFCGTGDKSRKGAMSTILHSDMLTIKEEPVTIVPGCEYGQGTSFENHEFFEAPSIRKIGETYYFIYSSKVMHELCYATSKSPRKDFKYGGVIVSNSDLHIDTYKPADMPSAYGANNHGGLVNVNGNWYIFYHRQTNGTWFCRQGCAEKISIDTDGSISQVELTSCGLNPTPLAGAGYYPGYIACNLFTDRPSIYVNEEGGYPKIMQDGSDGDENDGYIGNMKNSATAGFKYFDCNNVTAIHIFTRGYASGEFVIRTSVTGDILGRISIENSNVWEKGSCFIHMPNGKQAIYLTYLGTGTTALQGFELVTSE